MNERPVQISNVSSGDDNSETEVDVDIGESIDENVILERLNQLRQWQEEQRLILAENQLDQQKMLQLEKQKLYELFGLVHESSIGSGTCDNSDINCTNEIQEYLNQSNKAEGPLLSQNNKNRPSKSIEDKEIRLKSPSVHQMQNIIRNIGKGPKMLEYPDENIENVPKRPFLKRGEGLKNRFKISPDAFRLDNLPKYKFAKRTPKHAQNSTKFRKKCHQSGITNDAKTLSAADTKNKYTTEGCQYDEQHQYQYQRQHQYNNLRETTDGYAFNENIPISNGQTQQLNPKQNIPKNKSDSGHHVNQYKLNCQREEIFDNRRVNPASSQPHLSTPLAKYLLDTPARKNVQLQQDALNELEHFEQLEQDLEQYSRMGDETGEKNMVRQFKVGLSLSPNSYAARDKDDVNESQEKNVASHSMNTSFGGGVGSVGGGDESKHVRFTSSAVRIENEGQQPMEDIYAIPQPHASSPSEKSMESFQRFKEKLFDRKLKRKFQNQLSLAKDFEISDLNSNDSIFNDDERQSFGFFGSVDGGEGTSSISGDGGSVEHSSEDKNAYFQEQLANLEQEIQSFRNQNTELTGLIREHELIRMTFDQERQAANERMENERINFEMYMHDERMKFLNEKSNWEKNLKDSQKLTRTEKDELIRLREKCAKHETELSAQEQRHVAAQARVRAQLKSTEKEFKELRFEVENLRRENKKLETENVRLRRESNNKILSEINKSISKLAKANESPHYENQTERECHREWERGKVKEKEKEMKTVKNVKNGVKKCSNQNAHKTVVAKVTSHREPLKGNRIRSKSVPDLKQNADEYVCDLVSDDENSESSPNEMDSRSNYFHRERDENFFKSAKNDEFVPNDVMNQSDGGKSTKRIIENSDGSKDVWYSNGNLKKISADGMCTRMLYFNKDIKETDIKEGTVKYYYAETNTWQTTYLDGLEIFEYPDGQTEHRYKNGIIEIHFPNGSIRITNPDREQTEGIKEEWKYPDGTNVIQLTNGERILMLPNGQREVHANGHKRREYPDGTVKIVYPDGSQETRYSNGRVRLKNKEGKLIMDSETISI